MELWYDNHLFYCVVFTHSEFVWWNYFSRFRNVKFWFGMISLLPFSLLEFWNIYTNMLFSKELFCKQEKMIVCTISKLNITKNGIYWWKWVKALSQMLCLGFSPRSSLAVSTIKKEKFPVNFDVVIRREILKNSGKKFFKHYGKDIKTYITSNTDFSWICSREMLEFCTLMKFRNTNI